jgi:hypothetical protein
MQTPVVRSQEWVVQDISEDDTLRLEDVRLFAESADHAKQRWFELMAFAEDDGRARRKVVPI